MHKYFSSPDADNSSARLLYVTFSKYEEDWTSLRHSHHFCELFYVKNGKGEFVIEDDTIPIQKDDLILVNPNVAHTEISFHTEPLEYVILGVDGVVFSFSQQSQYMILHCKNDTQTLLFYFSTLLKEITEKKPDYELACQKLLDVLHKYYFVHIFTNTFGISPISYLQKKRILASCELLTDTDHSIGEIAQLTGFSSQSYFSQCFLKQCGMTAGAYRKKHKITI